VLAGGAVGQLGISFAFGLAVVAMAYGVGPVSGAHLNPALSFAQFLAGRQSGAEMAAYWIAQFAGAAAGAGVLWMIASGQGGPDLGGFATNGWGEGYNGGYTMMAALTFEVVATFILAVVFLGATDKRNSPAFAGLAIGLTLAVIHIVGIQVTGVSVNPARSFGPAVFVQGEALSSLWLFFFAPLVGAAIAARLFQLRGLRRRQCPRRFPPAGSRRRRRQA
jgi:aquaporin Z